MSHRRSHRRARERTPVYYHQERHDPSTRLHQYRNVSSTSSTTSAASASFIYFPKLPREIQLLIWEFACTAEAESTSCTLRIAPDIEDNRQALQRAETNITQPPLGVPTLLHVCRDSRTEAKKIYTLWPTVKVEIKEFGPLRPFTFHRTGSYIYVAKQYDIFYWPYYAPIRYQWYFRIFLHELRKRRRPDEEAEEAESSVFLNRFKDIKNLALDGDIWRQIGPRIAKPLLGKLLAKKVGIVLRNTGPTAFEARWCRSLNESGPLRSIMLDTIPVRPRNKVNEFIANIEEFLSSAQQSPIPEVSVLFVSTGDTMQDAQNDERFWESVEKHNPQRTSNQARLPHGFVCGCSLCWARLGNSPLSELLRMQNVVYSNG